MSRPYRIQVIYRNYIPLNSPYSSFWLSPPANIEFLIPKPLGLIKHFFPIYRALARYAPVQKLVRFVSDQVFSKPQNTEDISAYFYVGLIPKEIPTKPFFIDLEHVNALVDFLGPEEFKNRKDYILKLLCDPMCKGVIPLSEAAAKTVAFAFGDDFAKFSAKVKVIYPSLFAYVEKYKGKSSDRYIKKSSPQDRHFLFVGKESLRKGLPQVLEAFDRLSAEFPHIFLTVVSDTPDSLKNQFQHSSRIQFFEPRFSTDEIVTHFFMPSDIFLLPTLEDSFGMVYLEALSAGLPVILTKQFATPEIVQENINGLFLNLPKFAIDEGAFLPPKASHEYTVSTEFHQKMVVELMRCMRLLLTDDELLKKMKAAAPTEFFDGGKFSNSKRNAIITDQVKALAREHS